MKLSDKITQARSDFFSAILNNSDHEYWFCDVCMEATECDWVKDSHFTWRNNANLQHKEDCPGKFLLDLLADLLEKSKSFEDRFKPYDKERDEKIRQLTIHKKALSRGFKCRCNQCAIKIAEPK